MPVTKYISPEELQTLTAALERHCHDHGIEAGEEHQSLTRLVMTFYHSGMRNIEELTKALAATKARARPSLQ